MYLEVGQAFDKDSHDIVGEIWELVIFKTVGTRFQIMNYIRITSVLLKIKMS